MNFLEEIESYLQTPPLVKGFASESVYHEGLKAQLYVFGFKKGYWSMLEATPSSFKSKYRLDCIYCDKSGKLKVAIELDRTIKKRSLEKLNSLPNDVEKIIISYNGDEESFYKAKSRRRELIGSVQILRLKLFRPNKTKGGWSYFRK